MDSSFSGICHLLFPELYMEILESLGWNDDFLLENFENLNNSETISEFNFTSIKFFSTFLKGLWKNEGFSELEILQIYSKDPETAIEYLELGLEFGEQCKTWLEQDIETFRIMS